MFGGENLANFFPQLAEMSGPLEAIKVCQMSDDSAA